MKRPRNTSCISTGKVGAKMPIRKKPISRVYQRLIVHLKGGPFDGAVARLDAAGDLSTLPIVAMKGFPSGRYINRTWTPDTNEALPDLRNARVD